MKILNNSKPAVMSTQVTFFPTCLFQNLLETSNYVKFEVTKWKSNLSTTKNFTVFFNALLPECFLDICTSPVSINHQSVHVMTKFIVTMKPILVNLLITNCLLIWTSEKIHSYQFKANLVYSRREFSIMPLHAHPIECIC